jgi:hypothetical protein
MMHKLFPLLAIAAVVAAVAAGLGYATVRANWGMGGYGSRMSGSGYSMMGPHGAKSTWYLNGSGPVKDITGARAQAQLFADKLGLKTGEVMQFANNFYVLLLDQQGKPATEVLVDPETGAVTLEYGPAMMWNTKYGMMQGTGSTGYGRMMGGGMMGGTSGTSGTSTGMMGGAGMMDGMMGSVGGHPTWTPSTVSGSVDVTQAHALANTWLGQQGSGLSAAEPDALPGYFTFHVMKDGKITGMLSVNARTGAVWYHWWHGRFIAMEG